MIPGMARLGINQYGKAETHLVRVIPPDDAAHEVRDLLVSVALSGALEAVHLEGDDWAVLATDTQKNTVYAFGEGRGVGTPEQFAGRARAALRTAARSRRRGWRCARWRGRG